jgi:hypothetical protein
LPFTSRTAEQADSALPQIKGAGRNPENCHSITGTGLYDTLAISQCC